MNPEALLAERQRRERLAPVVQALPPRERRCLQLRAEGLRYRDIANTLGMSLGGVAKSSPVDRASRECGQGVSA